MDRVSVPSTLIATIGYDTSSQTLEVEFAASGAVWQYTCTPEQYAYLRNAPSIGREFNATFKRAAGIRAS